MLEELRFIQQQKNFKKYFGIQGDIDIVKQQLFKRRRKEPEITA